MKGYYFAVLTCITLLITSCMGVNQSEVNELRAEIIALKARVDSLSIDRKIESFKTPVVITKKLKSKKAKAALPLSSNGDLSQLTSVSHQETRTQLYSSRCQAITQKGTQCKRTARSGGYCWQHGG